MVFSSCEFEERRRELEELCWNEREFDVGRRKVNLKEDFGRGRKQT